MDSRKDNMPYNKPTYDLECAENKLIAEIGLDHNNIARLVGTVSVANELIKKAYRLGYNDGQESTLQALSQDITEELGDYTYTQPELPMVANIMQDVIPGTELEESK